MSLSALTPPTIDPTPIFEHFRGHYATELLTAAVCHFDLFGRLARSPRTLRELASDLSLLDRPATVLTTSLRAMGLLRESEPGRLTITELAREHLLPGGRFDIGGYIGLAAQNPGVLAMVEALKSNRPAQVPSGTMYTFREGVESAMDEADSARHFTLALAGRAINVAPHLARAVDLSEAATLLDVGGGSGVYAIALLERFPKLRAIVFDRGEVLKVAQEFAAAHGVGDRLEFRAGDMFADPFPPADVALFSNILHDWDIPECRTLVAKAAASCGTILVHDVFLNDALDGPLPHALYSAALFTLTEGRLYSAAEASAWLRAAGKHPQPVRPTLIHCGVLLGA
jgi:predicted O-methyltransferase YrrM